MNIGASRVFANGYMKGFFDVIGAMLSESPSFEVAEPQDAASKLIADFASRYTVILQSRVKTGGAIALMLQLADIRAIAAKVMGEEPPEGDQIADDEMASLVEIFDPCLGGGVSHFKESYGNVIELERLEITPCAPGSEAALAAFLGKGITASAFTYMLPPDMDSDGVLFFSQNLEENVPPEARGDQVGGAELSQEEMGEILSGFGNSPVVPEAPPVKRTPPPENIDMVLDIRLEATARLGRVELPVAEILTLGPGSIIDVGHLVDEPVELLVNDKLIARGDVVVVDEKFGLRITEIVSTKERIESLR